MLLIQTYDTLEQALLARAEFLPLGYGKRSRRLLWLAIPPLLIERGHQPQAHQTEHETIRGYPQERSCTRAAEELDPGPRLGRQRCPTETDKRLRFHSDTTAQEQVTRRYQTGVFHEDIEDCRVQHAGQQERAHPPLQEQRIGIHDAMHTWNKRSRIVHA